MSRMLLVNRLVVPRDPDKTRHAGRLDKPARSVASTDQSFAAFDEMGTRRRSREIIQRRQFFMGGGVSVFEIVVGTTQEFSNGIMHLSAGVDTDLSLFPNLSLHRRRSEGASNILFEHALETTKFGAMVVQVAGKIFHGGNAHWSNRIASRSF